MNSVIIGDGGERWSNKNILVVLETEKPKSIIVAADATKLILKMVHIANGFIGRRIVDPLGSGKLLT